jgi:uncharacterized iron-regulated membrane protein
MFPISGADKKRLKIADNLIKMNYDIHSEAILGLPGKIVAFLISLFIASLPISGLYIWWGRSKKKAKTVITVNLKKEKQD